MNVKVRNPRTQTSTREDSNHPKLNIVKDNNDYSVNALLKTMIPFGRLNTYSPVIHWIKADKMIFNYNKTKET